LRCLIRVGRGFNNQLPQFPDNARCGLSGSYALPLPMI
jgi:hypothetical protein